MKKKFSRIFLSLLLAAIMITEPVTGSAVAFASEPSGIAATGSGEGAEQSYGEEEDGNGQDSVGKTESLQDDTESGEGQKGDTVEEKTDDAEEEEENTGKNPDQSDLETEGTEGEAQADEEISTEDEAVSEDGLMEEEELLEDALSEEELLVKTQEADELDGFSAMPSGYVLSSEQKSQKSSLASTLSTFDEDAEGILYVEREVFAFADTLEEAEAIAQAYHAELTQYDLGVVTMKLTEGTAVAKALNVAASQDNNLPAVYPNYYRYTSEVTEETQEDDSLLEIEEEVYEITGVSEEAIAEEADLLSEEAYEAAAAAYSDPYLTASSAYYQWQHVNVGSVYAWNAGYTGSGVKVAVLDSGVTPMSGELTLSGSYNTSGTTNSDSNTTDDTGHGTHVAGIIGAASNTTGGAGIAPGASIYNVKVLSNGTGTDDNIIRGITKAIEWKVDIINMSLGGVGYNAAFQSKVTEAYNAGIAVFAAAGNDGGTNMCYPAAYDHVISVAAVDNNNQRAYFSNYGS